MPGPTIVIGCKLPNGHVLEVNKVRVVLQGSRTSGIAGGYGLTVVDQSFWAEWVKQYKNLPVVKNGIIFAQDKEINAKAQAADTKTITTGLEPMAQLKAVPGVSQAVPLDPGQSIEPAERPDGPSL